LECWFKNKSSAKQRVETGGYVRTRLLPSSCNAIHSIYAINEKR